MTQSVQIVHREDCPVIDVFGPTLEFLTLPEENYCVMVGTIPAGGSVPLHSHPDLESFFLLSGTVQALFLREEKFEWRNVEAGEFVHVPSGVKHAWRNTSDSAAVHLMATTPKLGRFFQEIGRPIHLPAPLSPPTPEDLLRFASVAARYGYWLGSPEENAAIGLPGFEMVYSPSK